MADAPAAFLGAGREAGCRRPSAPRSGRGPAASPAELERHSAAPSRSPPPFFDCGPRDLREGAGRARHGAHRLGRVRRRVGVPRIPRCCAATTLRASFFVPASPRLDRSRRAAPHRRRRQEVRFTESTEQLQSSTTRPTARSSWRRPRVLRAGRASSLRSATSGPEPTRSHLRWEMGLSYRVGGPRREPYTARCSTARDRIVDGAGFSNWLAREERGLPACSPAKTRPDPGPLPPPPPRSLSLRMSAR